MGASATRRMWEPSSRFTHSQSPRAARASITLDARIPAALSARACSAISGEASRRRPPTAASVTERSRAPSVLRPRGGMSVWSSGSPDESGMPPRDAGGNGLPRGAGGDPSGSSGFWATLLRMMDLRSVADANSAAGGRDTRRLRYGRGAVREGARLRRARVAGVCGGPDAEAKAAPLVDAHELALLPVN